MAPRKFSEGFISHSRELISIRNLPWYSIAHSEKGWTDKIIGRLWIEDFEKKTRTKANGQTRLLLVDGHNSHYTKNF